MNNILINKISSTPNKILIAFLFSVLIAISSKISVPFYPVPMTMQTFVVLMTGVMLGARFGFVALTFYIVEGALGLPVFSGTPAKGIGLSYMMGPTGGYIIGYALSALVAGYLFSKSNKFLVKKNIVTNFAKLTIALIPTYVFGLIWLGSLLGWDKPIFEWGMYPFLIGELFKVSLLSMVISKLNK